MQSIKLYKITNGNETIVTPHRPSQAGYHIMWRLVADTGKVLYDGTHAVPMIDTEDTSLWSEINPEDVLSDEPASVEELEEIMDIILGGNEL